MDANERFGRALIEYLNQRGWHSGSRRELSVALLHFAAEAGVLNPGRSRFALSMDLKVPPSTLDGLLRDRVLYFAQPGGYGLEDFLSWIRRCNHTTLEDAKSHRLVVALPSASERLSVERFLDELGYTPDLKNNHRLMVIDLDRLLLALARHLDVRPESLLDGLKIDHAKLMEVRDRRRDLLELALKTLSEQAGKHLGESIVDLGVHLCRRAYALIKRA